MLRLETIACSNSSGVAFIYNDFNCEQEYICWFVLFTYSTIFDINFIRNVLQECKTR